MARPETPRPWMPAEGAPALADLAAGLLEYSGRTAGLVRAPLRKAMQGLVRTLNCYYSNLIEGQPTYPQTIARALARDFSEDPRQQELQHLALAHLAVQERIDRGDAPAPAASVEFLAWTHREFARQLPETLRWVRGPLDGTAREVVPGAFRSGGVTVGQHEAPHADAVPELLLAWEQAYRLDPLSRVERIVAVAAAHHRLLWIHPFYDGNGRVARLTADAMLRDAGLESGLWAVSRGLARTRDAYYQALSAADRPESSGDPSGPLSMDGLRGFCRYFLETCRDQAAFMEGLLEPATLAARVARYAAERERDKTLSRGAGQVLAAIVNEGAVARGQVPALTGFGTSWSTTLIRSLLREGLVVSDSPYGALRLAFPPPVLPHYFPALYLGPQAGLEAPTREA